MQCMDSSSNSRFCVMEHAMLDFNKMHDVKRPGRSTGSRRWDSGFLTNHCEKETGAGLHPYTPLYTPIHPYTTLYTPIHPYTHPYTPLYTAFYTPLHIPLYTLIHPYTPLRPPTPLYIPIHRPGVS